MTRNVYLLRIAIHVGKAIDAQNVYNNHQCSNCPVGNDLISFTPSEPACKLEVHNKNLTT